MSSVLYFWMEGYILCIHTAHWGWISLFLWGFGPTIYYLMNDSRMLEVILEIPTFFPKQDTSSHVEYKQRMSNILQCRVMAWCLPGYSVIMVTELQYLCRNRFKAFWEERKPLSSTQMAWGSSLDQRPLQLLSICSPWRLLPISSCHVNSLVLNQL